MRFINKVVQRGGTRIIKKLALFPVCAKNGSHYETRWLERVTVKQKYIDSCVGWINVEFIDEP